MQIFIKSIEGQTLTLNVKDSMSVAMVKQLIADKVVEERCKSRLIYGGTQLDDSMRLSDYNIVKGSTIFEEGRLRGGMPKIIKTVVKSKALEKVTAKDENVFKEAFTTATRISASSSFNIKEAINTMKIEDLESLKSFLSNRVGNTPNHRMMSRVYEFLDFYRNLSIAQEKLNSSMQHFRDLVQADIDENFTDDSGKVLMEQMKEAVSNALAIKQSNAMAG